MIDTLAHSFEAYPRECIGKNECYDIADKLEITK